MSDIGRPSKYSPETTNIILDAIAATGSDRAGWEAGQISESTFYYWKAEFLEFSEQVARAKLEYRESCPEVIKRQAQRAFADYLFGRVTETWTTTKTTDDPLKGVIREESTKTVTRGVPKWAIERVLGKNLDVLDALLILMSNGMASHDQAEIVADGIRQIRTRLNAGSPEEGEPICDIEIGLASPPAGGVSESEEI